MVEEYRVTESIEFKRKTPAENLLNGLLNGRLDYGAINELYSPGFKARINGMLEDFIADEVNEVLISAKKVRPLADITKSELYVLKNNSSDSVLFHELDLSLAAWKIPKKNIFEEIYGNYASFVIKNFTEFNDLEKVRKCDLPYTKHLLRVSLMAKEVKFDNNSGKFPNYYTALWALHDSVEELVYSIKDHNGKIKYGLEGIKIFLDDYIPKEMHQDIMMLTNKSDLILKYLAEKGNKMKNEIQLDECLNDLEKNEKYDYVLDDVKKMRKVLKTKIIKTKGKSFFEEAKWLFYKEIFINDLGEQAYSKDHLALFEGKGILDLFDNYVGRHAGSLDERRKAIRKPALWESKAEEIVERGKKEGKDYSFFEGRVVEIMNFANFGARELIINYLSQPLAHIEHLRSALKSFKFFKDVLYMK